MAAFLNRCIVEVYGPRLHESTSAGDRYPDTLSNRASERHHCEVFRPGMMLLGALSLAAGTADMARVSVGVAAPWVDDPVVELAELLWSVHGASPLLRFLRAHAVSTCEGSAVACALETAEPLVSPLAHRALGASLAVRTAAPKAQAWSRLAATVSGPAPEACWFAACGKVHPTLEAGIAALGSVECASRASAAPAALGAAQATLDQAPFAEGGVEGSRLAVYLDPHAPGEGLLECLSDLEAAAPPSGSAVVLRYRPAGGSLSVPLQGFGFELTPKSAEYKTLDDRKGRATAAPEEEEEEEEKGGSDGTKPSWLLRRKGTDPHAISVRRRLVSSWGGVGGGRGGASFAAGAGRAGGREGQRRQTRRRAALDQRRARASSPRRRTRRRIRRESRTCRRRPRSQCFALAGRSPLCATWPAPSPRSSSPSPNSRSSPPRLARCSTSSGPYAPSSPPSPKQEPSR